MGHVDNGHPEVFVDMFDLVLHFFAQVLVQGTERFVHENQIGLEHQRPRHGHPLLLPAGQLRGAAAVEARQPDHLERPLDLRCSLGLRILANLQRKRQIFRHRHVGEQRVVLEYHSDIAPVRRDPVDRAVIQVDLTMGGRFEPCEHHQAGGLARTGRPEHGQKFAGRNS